VTYKGVKKEEDALRELHEERRQEEAQRRAVEEQQRAQEERVARMSPEQRRNQEYNVEDYGLTRQDVAELEQAEASLAARHAAHRAAMESRQQSHRQRREDGTTRYSTASIFRDQYEEVRDYVPDVLELDSWVGRSNLTLEEILVERAIMMSLMETGVAAQQGSTSSEASDAAATAGEDLAAQKQAARELNGITDELRPGMEAEEVEEYLLAMAMALSLSQEETGGAGGEGSSSARAPEILVSPSEESEQRLQSAAHTHSSIEPSPAASTLIVVPSIFPSSTNHLPETPTMEDGIRIRLLSSGDQSTISLEMRPDVRDSGYSPMVLSPP
jgi:hypothetical protein